MGVHVLKYTGFGWLLNYKAAIKNLEQKFENVEEFLDTCQDSSANPTTLEIEPNISIIQDGHNAEYLFIGKIFEKACDSKELHTGYMPEITQELALDLKNKVKNYFDLDTEPRYVILCNYR